MMRDEAGAHHGEAELSERPSDVRRKRVVDEADGPDRDDAGKRETTRCAAREGTTRSTSTREAFERARGAEREEGREDDEVAWPHGPSSPPLHEAGVHAEHERHEPE